MCIHCPAMPDQPQGALGPASKIDCALLYTNVYSHIHANTNKIRNAHTNTNKNGKHKYITTNPTFQGAPGPALKINFALLR